MIYLDNAATTRKKPKVVYEAFEDYIYNIGVSPGRGSYGLGIEASRKLYKTRNVVSEFFGAKDSNVIFTKNSTEAINLFFNGYLTKDAHVIISCYEHNAVLRPLHNLMQQGLIEYTVISRDDLNLSPKEIYNKYAKPNTKLFATTLASNLTGRIIFDRNCAKYMNSKGIDVFVDASQGAGKINIDMEKDNIDYLAFTGHKDLLALPGVGGLVCKIKPNFKPLLQGGTGVLGDKYVNPEVFPECYEAGTQNMPAIVSLLASLEWIEKNRNNIIENEKNLIDYFIKQLKNIPKCRIYDENCERVGVIGLNIDGFDSSEIVEYLNQNDICTRGGIHCAILAHQSLGTEKVGVVRFSLNWNNTIEEINKVIEVLKKVGEK